MGSRRYIVESKIGNGWENTWQESEFDPVTFEHRHTYPVVFHSKRDARQALEEFLSEEQEAFKQGYIDEPYFKCDFRITRIDNAKE